MKKCTIKNSVISMKVSTFVIAVIATIAIAVSAVLYSHVYYLDCEVYTVSENSGYDLIVYLLPNDHFFAEEVTHDGGRNLQEGMTVGKAFFDPFTPHDITDDYIL